MPLPPSNSRAHATVSRHLDVQNALASAAWASRQLAFGKQLRLAHDQALRSRDVREHPGEEVLHELERADRFSELQTLLGIFDRSLVRAHRASGRHPAQRHSGSSSELSRCRGTSCRPGGGLLPAPGTSFSVMWPFCTTLSAILFSIFSTLKPGVVLFSTMKPLTWLSATSRAQMIEMSHQGALPIQRFSPLRIQVSPSRFAVVRSPPDAPEPTSGSVRPKQPIFSKRAIGGSHFCFCSSDPSI